MIYIRLDYALLFFIVFLIIDFLREVYIRSRQKPSDFDSGYRKAIDEIAIEWNNLNGQKITKQEHYSRMFKFIQQKVDRM